MRKTIGILLLICLVSFLVPPLFPLLCSSLYPYLKDDMNPFKNLLFVFVIAMFVGSVAFIALVHFNFLNTSTWKLTTWLDLISAVAILFGSAWSGLGVYFTHATRLELEQKSPTKMLTTTQLGDILETASRYFTGGFAVIFLGNLPLLFKPFISGE